MARASNVPGISGTSVGEPPPPPPQPTMDPFFAADDGSAGYRGAEVVSVEPDSPAAEAGLVEGDLVIGVDDTPVGGAGALTGVVRGLEVGSTHQLEVVRDGSVQTIEITLAAREG